MIIAGFIIYYFQSGLCHTGTHLLWMLLIHSLFVLRRTPLIGGIHFSDTSLSRFPLLDVSFIEELLNSLPESNKS